MNDYTFAANEYIRQRSAVLTAYIRKVPWLHYKWADVLWPLLSVMLSESKSIIFSWLILPLHFQTLHCTVLELLAVGMYETNFLTLL